MSDVREQRSVMKSGSFLGGGVDRLTPLSLPFRHPSFSRPSTNYKSHIASLFFFSSMLSPYDNLDEHRIPYDKNFTKNLIMG